MLEVDDLVIIRSDLRVDEAYDGVAIDPDRRMPKEYGGREAKITHVEMNDRGKAIYWIDLDGEIWTWTEPMFETINGFNDIEGLEKILFGE